jgi:hypothetical protein
VPTLVVQVASVVPRVRGNTIAEVAGVQPMIVAIIAFIMANVVGNVVCLGFQAAGDRTAPDGGLRVRVLVRPAQG